MPKTTADIPPGVAGGFAREPRPDAIATAEGEGYTKTAPMKRAQQVKSKQYGLPKSGKGMKVMPLKGKV